VICQLNADLFFLQNIFFGEGVRWRCVEIRGIPRRPARSWTARGDREHGDLELEKNRQKVPDAGWPVYNRGNRVPKLKSWIAVWAREKELEHERSV
jgi:hypothetical protein